MGKSKSRWLGLRPSASPSSSAPPSSLQSESTIDYCYDTVMPDFDDFYPPLIPPPIQPPPSLPPPALVDDDDDDDDEEPEQYGNKSIFFSISTTNEANYAPWFIIDPNNLKGDVKYSPEFNLPSSLVMNFINYRSVVCNSTMYTIGGERRWYFFDKCDIYEFSNKMFMYDPADKCWHLTSSELNVPRARFQALVINNLIYVFGGVAASSGSTLHLNANNWIERYDPKDKTWELVPSNVPCCKSGFISDELPEINGNIHSAVLYKRGHRILFFGVFNGFHTFDYVNKTWAFVRTKLNHFNCFRYRKVVIVKHVMFGAFNGTIHVYDLKRNIVMASSDFNDPRRSSYAKDLYLFRVGMNTLLLLYSDVRCIKKGKYKKEAREGIYCRRFQIQYDSSGIRLVQDAHHFFASRDRVVITDFLVL